jgi:hypothetical protein
MGASGLGTLLVKEGFLTEQDRITITKTCGQGSWAFAKSILTMGLLDEDELAAFFAERTRYMVAPKNFLERLDLRITDQIDRRMVSRLEVLPLEIDHQRITVAVADPLDKSTLKQLEFFTGLEVVPVIAPLSQIYEGLVRLNPEFKPRFTALSNFLRNHAGTAWVKQKLIENPELFERSARSGASAHSRDQDDDMDGIEELDESSDELEGIEEASLDKDVGSGDFDDVEIADDSDLELSLSEGQDDLEGGLGPLDDPQESSERAAAPKKAGEHDPWSSADHAPVAGPGSGRKSEPDLESLDLLDESNDDDGISAGDDPGGDIGLDDPFNDVPATQRSATQRGRASPDDDFDTESLSAPADLDDPFGSETLQDTKSKEASLDDALMGDDFGLDDATDQPKPAAKASAPEPSLDDDLLGDFGLEDATDQSKPAAKASAPEPSLDDDLLGDFGLEDATDQSKPATMARAPEPSLDDDLLGDFGLEDATNQSKPAAKASDPEPSLDDDLLGDFGLEDATDQSKPAAKTSAPEPSLDDDLLGDFGLEDATDQSKPATKASAQTSSLDDDLLGEDVGPEPVAKTKQLSLDDDLLGEDFAPEDTKSRKSVPSRTELTDLDKLDLDAADDRPRATRAELAASLDADDSESIEEGIEDGFHDSIQDDEPDFDLQALKDGPDDPVMDLVSIHDTLPSQEKEALRLHEEDFDPASELSKKSTPPTQGARTGFPPPPPGPGRTEANPSSTKASAPTSPSNQEGSLQSLSPAALANECLLRLSLCFHAEAARQVAIEYAPQLASEGALFLLGQRAQSLLWNQGQLLPEVPKELHAFARKLAGQVDPNTWRCLPLPAKVGWPGQAKELAIYLWGAGDQGLLWLADHPIDDEAQLEAYGLMMEQLGSKTKGGRVEA